MKTAFDDYEDNIRKMNNALDARDYYLKQMANHLNDVSDACGEMADYLGQALENIQGAKDSVLDVSVN